MTQAITFARQHRERFLEELKNLLRIPSVSTQAAHQGDMEKASRFLADELNRLGLDHVEIIREHGDRLKADCALVCDTEFFAPELPTLCVGLRGMLYLELEAVGAKTDLHSGMYGGAAPNPLFALSSMIAKMKDENGTVQIPGFYDRVRKPDEAELKAWAARPFDEAHYRKTEVGST